ncbi:hypothetical protein GCM10020216_079420 [Nonomuraea helvata]
MVPAAAPAMPLTAAAPASADPAAIAAIAERFMSAPSVLRRLPYPSSLGAGSPAVQCHATLTTRTNVPGFVTFVARAAPHPADLCGWLPPYGERRFVGAYDLSERAVSHR